MKLLHSFKRVVFYSALAITTAASAQSNTSSTPYFSDPAVSPNGSEIAFVSGGDIWTVPAAGGEARLLVSDPAYESRPLYSPDGRFLAFVSTRTGNGDIYVLDMKSGATKRLTFDDGADELSAWSWDGRYLYFSTGSHEISGMRDIYRVAADGGTPMPVSANRYTNEFYGAPSPDGKTLVLSAKGIASIQWWRNGHSHLDESEIWLMKEGKQPAYEQLTEGGAREVWPMWSADGKNIYYVSDKDGAANLWARPLSGTARKLTRFTEGRVLWPTLSYDGSTIVFERNFTVWKYNTASGEAAPVAITRRGVPASPAPEHRRLTSGFRDLALSPDGKKIAFTAHGEVFVASAKEGGDAERVTNTEANETQLLWAPNSNVLVYRSDREGTAHLYQYDFIAAKESRLTDGEEDDASPLFSPDGRMLAFIRDGKELRVLNMGTRKETLVTKGYLGRPPFANGAMAWSPDGKWIAFAAYGAQSLRNIYVVPAAGGAAKPVSFLANTFGSNVFWSPDGKSIYFTTGQRTENTRIAKIDLVPQRPKFREDEFRDLFTNPVTNPATAQDTTKSASGKTASADTLFRHGTKHKATEAVEVEWEGLHSRLNLLPLDVDVDDIQLSKDGKTLVLSATVAGQINLFTWPLDELSHEPAVLKQLTFSPGYKTNMQLSADGKTVTFLENGRIQTVSLDTRMPKGIDAAAEMDIDFNREKMEVFREAWDVQNKGFYDPHFHGTDWQKVYTTYKPLAAGAATPDELRRLLSLMVGELNASHSGVSGPAGPQYTTGRIGLLFDRTEYERNGRLKISEVVDLSPADLAGGIKKGDFLVAVDGTPLSQTVNLDALLENRINHKVELTISSEPDGSKARTVSVRPVNQPTEKGLLYRQWVQQQRNYVAKISNGRLGYVHMYDMSANSLNQLYLDMDAENRSREGVVVDIRNNNGGFVNAYALDVLARKGYMTMTVRGLPSAPARTQLGQRALEAPTVLVTNRHSLSDAEDFTEGYRTLGLGKVVGEPTGGWIIYTSAAALIDGTVIRLPFIKVEDHEGKDMELHPRPVDIFVNRDLGEEDKDSQLDAAVKELLKELDARKKQMKE